MANVLIRTLAIFSVKVPSRNPYTFAKSSEKTSKIMLQKSVKTSKFLKTDLEVRWPSKSPFQNNVLSQKDAQSEVNMVENCVVCVSFLFDKLHNTRFSKSNNLQKFGFTLFLLTLVMTSH